MSKSRTSNLFQQIVTLSVIMLLSTGTTSAKEWTFQLEPYVLAASIDGETGIGRVTGVDVAVDFSDILETLEMGAMLHFEAHHDSGWGIALDYSFMDLRDDLPGPRGGIVGTKLRQGIFEGLLMRRLQSGNGTVDYFAGVRWWDNDIDVSIDPVVLPGSDIASIEQDWVDVVIGARWTQQYANDWAFQLRADVGGLGLESDFTSLVTIGMLKHFNDTLSLDILYKAAFVDFDTGTPGQPDYFRYDTVTHGPQIGLVINF